jgi:hypothetical protein
MNTFVKSVLTISLYSPPSFLFSINNSTHSNPKLMFI